MARVAEDRSRRGRVRGARQHCARIRLQHRDQAARAALIGARQILLLYGLERDRPPRRTPPTTSACLHWLSPGQLAGDVLSHIGGRDHYLRSRIDQHEGGGWRRLCGFAGGRRPPSSCGNPLGAAPAGASWRHSSHEPLTRYRPPGRPRSRLRMIQHQRRTREVASARKLRQGRPASAHDRNARTSLVVSERKWNASVSSVRRNVATRNSHITRGAEVPVDLGAQVADVDVSCARRLQTAEALHLLEQHGPRQHSPASPSAPPAGRTPTASAHRLRLTDGTAALSSRCQRPAATSSDVHPGDAAQDSAYPGDQLTQPNGFVTSRRPHSAPAPCPILPLAVSRMTGVCAPRSAAGTVAPISGI